VFDYLRGRDFRLFFSPFPMLCYPWFHIVDRVMYLFVFSLLLLLHILLSCSVVGYFIFHTIESVAQPLDPVGYLCLQPLSFYPGANHVDFGVCLALFALAE